MPKLKMLLWIRRSLDEKYIIFSFRHPDRRIKSEMKRSIWLK